MVRGGSWGVLMVRSVWLFLCVGLEHLRWMLIRFLDTDMWI